MDTLTAINDRLTRIEAYTIIGAKSVLTLDEAALYTGFSRGHLYRLTSGRAIPHYKRDRRLYFAKAELDEWMTATRVMTKSALEQQAEKYINDH